MKKTPDIYGIGWIEPSYLGEDDGGSPAEQDGPGEVVFTSVGLRDADRVAEAFAAAVGHGDGSGWYPVTRADFDRIVEELGDADEDALAVCQEMQDNEGDIVVVYAAAPDGDDPYVARLRDVWDSGRADVRYGVAHWWPTHDEATDPYPLIDLWVKQWPDSLPIAHELKELFEDQWVRFHSLPGSKRQAQTDADWATLLERHNAVLADLCADGDDLIVIVSEVSPAPYPEDLDVDFWTAVPWHYADPDLLFAHLFVSAETWHPGSLDELLRAAAEHDLTGVVIAPPELTWLYHPYDGGADVILPTPEQRAAIAERFADWRSKHPSGL